MSSWNISVLVASVMPFCKTQRFVMRFGSKMIRF
jgi:hypothetical protein